MSTSPAEPASFDAARVDAAVDALRPELIDFARSLVRIPSVSGSEQAAQRATDQLRQNELTYPGKGA